MKFQFTWIFFLFWFVNISFGQYSYLDAGAAIGISNYSGDISPPTRIQIIGTSRPSASAFLRYNINPRAGLKLSFNYANVAASDALSDKDYQLLRNLSFFSSIYELALTGEVNILRYSPFESDHAFTIYLSGGIGGFHFNPKAELDGVVYALREMGTEGQGLEAYPDREFYSLYELAVPFGAGLRYQISDNISLNLELGWRFTFTDYLDDVSTTYADYYTLLENRSEIAARLSNRSAEYLNQSEPYLLHNDRQRGNPDVGDYYFILNMGVSYHFEAIPSRFSNFNPIRRRSRTSSCPTF